jgi:hypothetical protein
MATITSIQLPGLLLIKKIHKIIGHGFGKIEV